MSPPLMGVETEYALSVRDAGNHGADRDAVARRLIARARRRLSCLPDLHGTGVFLGNGSRLYIDHGCHPEMATPECRDPWELVRYVEAGHAIMAALVGDLAGETPEILMNLFRCNVDYSGAQSTWGCHESYLHQGAPSRFPRRLIPHLITRILYTGSGGFDPTSFAPAFVLSPRAYHIERLSSSHSTHRRGVFHTKDEPLADRTYHRLHIVFGESQCSRTAMWLKVGTTALIVALIEAGLEPSGGIAFDGGGLRQLRVIASDPACEAIVGTIDGHPARAIDVQRRYLDRVGACIGQAFMPDWTEAVCTLWDRTLDGLDQGAPDAPTSLDWPIKHTLFCDYFARKGWDPEALRVLERIGPLAREAQMEFAFTPPGRPRGLRNQAGSLAPGRMPGVEARLARRGLKVADLEAYMALRARLLEADLRFGEVGDGSIFSRLEASGRLEPAVDGIGDVGAATEVPPPSGRASVRGGVIRRLSGKSGYGCEWQSVMSRQECLNMSDPYSGTEGEWEKRRESDDGVEGDILERLLARARTVLGE